ncbi:hypothetical protein E2C01_010884 [Portunus trituberculatus]|uniref:Uncharacterized protein n=1 Tax=Portunus trituberculatus TaxID=210409 RepID=A0A5B7D9X1_PORTR|nr:hypothetical protein [Portunus trituberculatus]
MGEGVTRGRAVPPIPQWAARKRNGFITTMDTDIYWGQPFAQGCCALGCVLQGCLPGTVCSERPSRWGEARQECRNCTVLFPPRRAPRLRPGAVFRRVSLYTY